MPQIKKITHLFFPFILIVFIIAGCTKANEKAKSVFNPESGKHPSDWITKNHKTEYTNKPNSCNECHGSDLTGGTSKISCTLCHMENTKTHLSTWYPDVSLNHSSYINTNGIARCSNANCHGANLTGGVKGPSCTSCHMETTKKHLSTWYPSLRDNHKTYVSTNGTGGCSNVNCHGTNLTGGKGPSCSSCHIWPFTLSNCSSCHGNPPSGSTHPNISGVHSVHTSLTGITCSTCHKDAGVNTVKHLNSTVDISIDSTYKGNSGSATYTPVSGQYSKGQCSNTSCHGGQTTPVWLTGSINVNTQCTSCHTWGASTGIPENNSHYGTGHYKKTITPYTFACTDCHDTTKLATYHFTDLNTASIGDAPNTIKTSLNYNTTTKTFTSGCGCHGAGWAWTW